MGRYLGQSFPCFHAGDTGCSQVVAVVLLAALRTLSPLSHRRWHFFS
jgi:hypothetical protein